MVGQELLHQAAKLSLFYRISLIKFMKRRFEAAALINKIIFKQT